MTVARTNSVPSNKLNLRTKLVKCAFFNNILVFVDSQLHSFKNVYYFYSQILQLPLNFPKILTSVILHHWQEPSCQRLATALAQIVHFSSDRYRKSMKTIHS